MQNPYTYFQGNSFSDLFAQDIHDDKHGFLLPYPSTALWATFHNTQKFFIQDGNISYDSLRKKEPWKNMSILGERVKGIMTEAPPEILVNYWKDQFGFSYKNMMVLSPNQYCTQINENPDLEKIAVLFPYDHILAEKHAVKPQNHYHILSKCNLEEAGKQYVPPYTVYDLRQTSMARIDLPQSYPYAIKVSHGLSGEGTYLIKSQADLNFCFQEIRHYLDHKTLDFVIVMDFVKNAVENYCVQFYINKEGKITLIGFTNQLVTEKGGYLGGLIHYEADMSRFTEVIEYVANFAHTYGYFGFVGIDLLEDKDGQLFLIDANIRVNGSTPLCLQRHKFLAEGKETAKYSSDYCMEGNLDSCLKTLKPYLDRQDFVMLSAFENPKTNITDIFGIVAGETLGDMNRIEENLQRKGLKINIK